MWIVNRAYGRPGIKALTQIAGSTIQGAVSALRSVHVDLNLPVTVFESPHTRRLISGATGLFPKRRRSPKRVITKELLKSLLSSKACEGESETDTLNLNAAFTLAFSGFLRMGEFTWTRAELEQPRTFLNTRPTRRCITMDDGSMEFFLPRSKTDVSKMGVSILIAEAADNVCAIRHMKLLLEQRPESPKAPLFRFVKGRAFTKKRVMNALNLRLARLGIAPGSLTGHSFRRGAAQHAHEMQVPIQEIQHMGRWTSSAVERYYSRSRSHKLRVQRRFSDRQDSGVCITTP